ncbi:uridine kinase, partial [Listeria monocytogenes]|nr:uridine kinase [Listeria monocytogenes]
MTKKPIVVGVTGGSGSGKTSVTKAICDHFSGHSILMIAQDVYYHDQANISFEDR